MLGIFRIEITSLWAIAESATCDTRSFQMREDGPSVYNLVQRFLCLPFTPRPKKCMTPWTFLTRIDHFLPRIRKPI